MALRNLVLPSANNLIFPSANNAVLAPLAVDAGVWGQHVIFGVLEGGRKGGHLVFGEMEGGRRGRYLITRLYPAYGRRGAYGIYGEVSGAGARGRHRVEDEAVEGWVAYVGYDEMPTYDQAPDGFSATSTIEFEVAPPSAGEIDLYVVKRKRNRYGLESQNQKPIVITIDTNGDEVLGPISAPQILGAVCAEGERFVLFLGYPGIETDRNPADKIRVYVGEGVAPVPGVDTPVEEEDASRVASVRLGPYHTGGMTYYFAVTVYRTEDAAESDADTAEVVLPNDPATPAPLNVGWVTEEE